MKWAAAIFFAYWLFSCDDTALYQERSRLVATATIMIYRDYIGNEFSYTSDSIHYGYVSTDPVKLKLLGALDRQEKYGLIKEYDPSDGDPNYGLHDVVPTRFDTAVEFTPGRRFNEVYPKWDHVACDPNPYSITINSYDASGNLTSLSLYHRQISCSYDGGLYLWFRRHSSYEYGNCIATSDTSYSASDPSSFFEITVHTNRFDGGGRKLAEFDSVTGYSKETGLIPTQVSNTLNIFDDHGRLVRKETDQRHWLHWRGVSCSRSVSATDYSYSGSQDSVSIACVYSGFTKRCDSDSGLQNRPPVEFRHLYTYKDGKLLRIISEPLHKTAQTFSSYSYPSESFEYDLQGRLIKETNPDTSSDQKWEWQYNDLGLPVASSKPEPESCVGRMCPNGNAPASVTITKKYYYQ